MILENGVEIIAVHYVSTNRIACIPGYQFAVGESFPWHRSDDPRAVTCPLCKDSMVFREALAKRPDLKWRLANNFEISPP